MTLCIVSPEQPYSKGLDQDDAEFRELGERVLAALPRVFKVRVLRTVPRTGTTNRRIEWTDRNLRAAHPRAR